jgi:hypothetical protein
VGKARRTKRTRTARNAERQRLRAKWRAELSPPKESWGGSREGCGRPRIYATNAERQAAYRGRQRERT